MLDIVFYKQCVINPHSIDEKTDGQKGELTTALVRVVGIWTQIYLIRKSTLWTLP